SGIFPPQSHKRPIFLRNSRRNHRAGAIMTRIGVFFASTTLFVGLALPAAAEPANLLGVFGNWTAYSSGTGSNLTCYALSKPRASRPAGAKRSSVYLMISDWPARKVKAEPQIVYGYPGKEGAPAALAVG